MAHTFYLTADEKALFDTLPEEIKEGCNVELEERVFKDSERDAAMRRSLAEFKSPKLAQFADQLRAADSEEKGLEILGSVDLTDLPESDIADLFFVFGPDALGGIIQLLLHEASTAEDIAQIADLTEVRSGLFEAFLPATVS